MKLLQSMVSFTKRNSYKEFFLLFFIILFFIVIVISLPIYDEFNGFHNIIFDNYTLKWYDGRSPINFYLTRNLIENGYIFFSKGNVIGSMTVENYFDFFYKNGVFYPKFNFIGSYTYAFILYIFYPLTDILLFKSMILLNILFSIFMLLIFYSIQKLLDVKIKYALMSTFIAGIATSILIYSRYLFIENLIKDLLFVSLIYLFLRNLKKQSLKTEILIIVNFSIFLIFLWNAIIMLIFFVSFSLFLIRYRLIKNIKIFIIINFTLIILLIVASNIYFSGYVKETPIDTKNLIIIRNIPILRVFPRYVNALDFSIFGYHDPSSVWKLDRTFSYIYAFEELKGNAIFLKIYGLFGSLFGPKGIIFNSLYLIFSIAGIFLYKESERKKLLLLSIVLIILIYGLLQPMWYGGVTPRYNRFYTIPALFLTFFSFYYIQEISKEKCKIKKYFIYTIFSILVVLSVLNVSSLAIRADWTYEHEANLVSYDLVIWPWYPPRTTENIINLYLTELGQSVEWKFGGEINGCKPYGALDGIITPLCGCEYATYAERSIEIPWEKVRVNFTACSGSSDGVIGRFYFDDKEKDLFIEPNSCKQETMLIENSSGNHNLILKPEKYKECTDEIVVWKLISIEKT